MPLQCPHCQSTIVIEGKPPREVVCPSCGTSIQLDPGSTTGWLPEEAPQRLGKFEFLEQLGIGSFGTVYKARDTELDRLVAVKIPRSGSIPSGKDMDRFLREARSAAQLAHSGIVSLYDAGTIDGTCCLVSEFIQGATLAEQLGANRFRFRQAAELIAEIGDALDYAHKRGVIHRDIKPSNIILDLAGRPHLMDFGLAKRSADEITMTLEGQLLGTPAYMSPEQARGEVRAVDARSDLYSLGVILYELLTGELPFRGQTRMLLVQVIQDEPRPPRRLNDRIPRDLETICLKAMAKEPSRRYQTARELADDLRRFLKGEPILARPVSAWERGIHWVKRRPALAGLLFVSSVAVVALGVVATALIYNNQLKAALQETEKERDKAEAANKEAERYRYFHHMAVAHSEWLHGNMGRVEPLLDDCPPDRRNWEWHYLKRLCHPELLTLRGHVGDIWDVAFSPDGKYVAAGGNKNTPEVKVWDATTGKLIHTLPGHSDYSGVAFGPDGKLLVSYNGASALVWDLTTERQICEPLKGAARVVFTQDGTRLVTLGPKGTLTLWNLATGQPIGSSWQGPTDSANTDSRAFSYDGTWIATANNNIVRVWDTATGRERYKLAGKEGHTAPVWRLAFSPDRSLLASPSDDEGIIIWDMATGHALRRLRGHSGIVWSVTFSPDGKRLASGGVDQTVRVWDVATGEEVFALRGHNAGVTHVVFSPDGTRLASVGYDGTVRIWSATVRQEAPLLKGHYKDAGSVAFNSAGTLLATGTKDNLVRIWDTATGQLMQSLPGHSERVRSVAFRPDGKWLASAGDDKTVRLWDLTTSRQIGKPLKGHTGAVRSVAFSPNGEQLASAGGKRAKAAGEVKIWDAKTGQVIHTFPQGQPDEICSMAFSPDGKRLASVGASGKITVWELPTGREIFARPCDSNVVTVAFSPDGKWLLSAGWLGWISLWDGATGQPGPVLKGHAHEVFSLAFSPDGTRLASFGGDGTVKIWDMATYQEVISLRGYGEADSTRNVVFSPDGTRLASVSLDGTIQIWDGRPWGPEAAVEREALGLLELLFTKPLRKADAIDYLRTSPTISSPGRDKALSLVDQYREETNPERFYEASWALARQRYLNTFQYQFALRQAEAACQLAPEQGKYWTALGAAQYRAGKYREALVSLTQADRLNKGTPADLCFLALTHHRLGDQEQARAALARLRETAQQARFHKDKETHDLLREAEAVLEPKVTDAEK